MRRYGTEGHAGDRGRGEGGFALVLVLLALLAFTALSTAGFMTANAEYRITENHREGLDAFYAADAGLQEYLGRGRPSTDTTSFSYAGGGAEVSSIKLVDVDSASTMWLVTSRALGPGERGYAGRRTVGTVALQNAAPFRVDAAFTAPPGLHKNGVAGTLSGVDAATSADCPSGGRHDVAGVAVPPGGFSMSGNGKGNGKGKGGGGGGGSTPPGVYGSPPVDESRTSQQLLAATNIPWQGVLNGSAIPHDFVASQGYPDFSMAVGADEWPVVYLDAASYSVKPPNSGRGILIAEGDLTMNGSFSWEGLVLAGGTITSNGRQTVQGAAVAGLNMLLGQHVPASNLGNGTWEFQYHSCNLLSALRDGGVPIEEPATWFERL